MDELVDGALVRGLDRARLDLLAVGEGDEPGFTQPLMYRTIRQHPPVSKLYADRLVQQGVIDKDYGAEVEMRFTQVLKGHIALATARFPAGTTGAQLDTLARAPLWEVGLDYDHGTGHGVGAYLSVHEGPQSISKRPVAQPLLPGMICSNEPGYYKTGGYGIRIENLIVVREAAIEGAERPMLEFETVTLAPIDVDLVEPSLLTAAEKAWLNAYHARVRETLTPLVDAETAAWLTSATRAV